MHRGVMAHSLRYGLAVQRRLRLALVVGHLNCPSSSTGCVVTA
jgi:hypothetical protein